ncbi:MAG: hypothetical protein SHS37scaffold145_22 [Phage 71_18]|nr:MAG: hypothetical protein SHS37scaffold145_22 [Phage 71_18]
MSEASDDATSGNGTTDAIEGGGEPVVPAEAPLRPEVMPPDEPGTAVVTHPYSALERAADAALQLPGLPGRDEFLGLAMQARILAMSAGAPKAVRDNPHLAFHIAMIGRDLGISPSVALQMVDVIGYNDRANTYDAAYDKVQLSISPELLNSQIKRLGLGSIVKVASRADQCTAVAMLPGGRVDVRCARLWPEHVEGCTCTFDLVLGEVTFTWQDAQLAGLVDSACTGPDAHTGICVNGGQGSQGKRCHQGYRSYPQRMMWWRASGWAQSDYFPEAGVGLYSPEELGAMVDAEGRAIDPAAVELPEGYEPKPAPPPPPSEDLLADAADDDELGVARRELRARLDAINAVPDARTALMTLWAQRDDDGNPKLPPFGHLRRRNLTMAKAMTLGIEQRIKRGEWGDEAKAAWTDATVTGAGFGGGAAQQPQEPAADDDAPAPAEDPAKPTAPQEPPQADDPGDDETLAAYERAVACSRSCGKAEAPAWEHAMDCPVRLTYTEPAAIELPPARPTPEQVAAQVAMLSPTEVIGRLTDLLPEGESVPRGKDARQIRLVDLIVSQLDAEAEEVVDDPGDLFGGGAPDAATGAAQSD